MALGRFREALTATRRCLDRLPQGHELRSNVLAQLGRCERLIALQDRLSAVLQGNDKAADASEAFEFAELCGILGQPAAAARLYAGLSTRRRDWPTTSTPSTAIGQLAPQRWLAAIPARRRRAQRSGAGAVAPAGPRVASGRGHPLEQRAGPRPARRSIAGCPEVGASVGRSPTGWSSGPRSARPVAAGRAPGMPRTAGRDRYPDPASSER